MYQGMQQTASMRQTQALAPQMRQSLDMLQMTSLELRAELQRQMETNPVIEDVVGRTERPLSEVAPDEHASGAVSERALDFTPTGEAAQQTLSCDDADRDAYLQNMENFHASAAENGAVDPDAPSRRQALFDRQVRPETLQEHLQRQIAFADFSDDDRRLAERLVAAIDDDGYFRGSIPDVAMVAHADEARILRTLAAIAAFDPLGCGGRDLRECLLYQMEKLDDSPWEDEVRTLVDRYLPDAAAHREAYICERLGIPPSDYCHVLAALRTLDPKPGRSFAAAEAVRSVRPEVFVFKSPSGAWKARVTDRDLPDIRISKRYLALLEDPNCPAETKSYVRERLRAAEALRDSIAERQETIQRIAQAIVDAQRDVFERKSLNFLRPLNMEQIAQKTNVHNATVSRTVRDKYMSTPLGVVEMRRFFTAGLATAGGEAVSNVAVKDRIRRLIDAEDKKTPLSDERLAQALAAEGIACARRTVAKYREALGIPGAVGRRIT